MRRLIHISVLRSLLLAMGLFCFCLPSKAQARRLDSIRTALTHDLSDSIRAFLMGEYVNELRFNDPVLALKTAKELKLLAEKMGSPRRIAATSSKLGLIYSDLGYLEKALDCQLTALQNYEKLKDTLQIAGAQLNVAMVYKKEGSFDQALGYLKISLVNFKAKKNKFGEAYVYNNMATISRDRRELDKAMEFFSKSLKIKEELKDSSTLGSAYLNMGLIHDDKGELVKAMEYYMKALKMFEATNNVKGFAGVYNNMGTIFIAEGEIKKAKEYLFRSQEYANKVHSKEDIVESELNLSTCFEKEGDFAKANEHFKRYRSYKDSILDASGAKRMALLQAVYETDKKDNELVTLKKDAQINEEQLNWNRILVAAVVGGILLVLTLVLLLFNRYRVRERLNKLLEETNDRISVRKKEITDSISYARRIQESILPRFEKYADIIPQSFLLHKPREIVSGDFYWIHRDGPVVYAAVADNVLHGVPGAFISMVGVNILNSAVEQEKVKDLPSIIDHMEKGIHEMLGRQESGRRLNFSICRIDTSTGLLEFVGNDNPLFLVNSKGVQEVKCSSSEQVSEVQTLQLKKGDTIYMFTDGYVDQMGGGEGKKMLTRKVSEILFRNWPIPMDKQKEGLLHEFESWRGNFEQVDDVLVMGIRF